MAYNLKYRFDRDIVRNERAYWITYSEDEIVSRIPNVKSGYEIYMLMTYCDFKHFRTDRIYARFGLDREKVREAESSGWTGGCFALAEHLHKPRRDPGSSSRPETQVQVDADPAWPRIQENQLRNLLISRQTLPPDYLQEISTIFPKERLAKVFAELPPNFPVTLDKFQALLDTPIGVESPAAPRPHLTAAVTPHARILPPPLTQSGGDSVGGSLNLSGELHPAKNGR